MDKPITHRCEQLLKHNEDFDKVSIQYRYRYNTRLPYEETKKWYLRRLETDFDWGSTYMGTVTWIEYCPYCGIKL